MLALPNVTFFYNFLSSYLELLVLKYLSGVYTCFTRLIHPRRSIMRFVKSLALLSIMSAAYGSTGNGDVHLVVQKGVPTSEVNSAELVSAKRILAFLKGKIGGEKIQSLLADEITQANAYWHQLLSNSTGTWTPVEAQAKAIADPTVLNSRSFQQWMDTAGAGYPNDLIAGHPEIYFEEEPSNVIQSWGGGPITQFSHDPVSKQPFMLDLPGWNVTATVAQTLRDKTIFSYAVAAIKDEVDGFGLYFAVYLPSSAPEERIAGLRSYLTVECTNWLRYAYRHAILHH